MAWTQHFTFGRFSRKRKFFGNFDCDAQKFFSKGCFQTEYEEFRNFSFDGRIIDNYRQPPLISFGNFFWTIYRTTWNPRPVYPSFQVFLNATSFSCTWNFERFHMTSGGHVDVSKQWNGGHVGVSTKSFSLFFFSWKTELDKSPSSIGHRAR